MIQEKGEEAFVQFMTDKNWVTIKTVREAD